MLARRQQFHQDRLGSWISQSSGNLQNQVDSLGRYLVEHGGRAVSLAQGKAMAQGNIYGQFLRQCTMLAYLDVIKVLAIADAVLNPTGVPHEAAAARARADPSAIEKRLGLAIGIGTMAEDCLRTTVG